MMKKITLSILAMLALWVCSPQKTNAATTVKTIDVTLSAYYSSSDYSGSDSAFSYKAIADALGTDTLSLTQNGKYLYATDIDGNMSNTYTADGTGFWFNENGIITAYGTSPHFYAGVDADPNKDYFEVYAGQMPGVGSAYPTYKTTLYLVSGDKQIQINLSFALTARPATDWTKMTFVKSYDVTVEETPRSNYNTKDASLTLSEIATALGTDAATLAKDGSYAVWAKDSLGYTQNFTAGTGNFWLAKDGNVAAYGSYWKKVYEAGVGKDSIMYNAWYVQNSFDTTNDKLTFSVGQYPDSLKIGDALSTVEYIVYNGKAVTVNIKLNIVAKPALDWNTATDAGDYTYNLEKYATDGYTTTAIKMDVENMAEKLGIDKSTFATEVSMYGIDGAGGHSDSYTTSSTGFWLTQQGTICSWGTNSYFYVDYAPADSTLNVGFYPGHVTVGDSYTTDLFFPYGDKYVKVTVNVTATQKKTLDNAEIVATYPLEVSAVPSASAYDVASKPTVDLNIAAAAIGEDVSTFIKNFSVYTVDSLGKYTDNYTCTPNPGFWFDSKDAQNVWGSSPYGVTYATSGTTGTFTFYQMPGKNAVGDTHNPKIYLIDTAAGKGVCYSFSFSFVESLDSIVMVGSKDIAVPVTMDQLKGSTTIAVPINLTDFATAIGIPSADLKATNTAYPITLYAPTATGGKTNTMTSDFGFWETKDGVSCTQDNESCMLGIEYYGLQTAATQDFDNLQVTPWGEAKDGDVLKGIIILSIKDKGAVKMYTYTVYLVTPSGINGTTITKNNAGNIYDLNGRIVRRNATSAQGLAKGIYIQNNKKIVVR